MKTVLKTYMPTMILILGLISGGLCGSLWPQAAAVLKPFGDIFINLLFVMVVPLVFFSVSMSFCRLHSGGNVGKVLAGTVSAFLIIWLTCGCLAYAGILIMDPLGDKSSINIPEVTKIETSWSQTLVSAFSVPDFPLLFSKNSLLPLIVFSAILGVGTSMAGDKGKAFFNFLESGNSVIIKALNFIMKAAPLGLGCYFADVIAKTGSHLLGGYLRSFILYMALALIAVLIIFPLIILIVRGKGSVKSWWKCILPPSLTAISTESSSIAIPGNIEAATGIGIDTDIAETVVPLSTNMLKAGSVMTSVIKIVFLISLCSLQNEGIGGMTFCIGLAILSAIVTGAVPGGGMSGEILICNMLGISPEFAGIIIIIGTIVDIPATLVNSQSTVLAAALVDRRKRKLDLNQS